MRSDWRPESNKKDNKSILMRELFFFRSKLLTFFIINVLLAFNYVHGQFYNIYPAEDIIPNTLPLNSSTIPLGAFLSFTAFDGTVQISRSSFEVICIECQKEIINNDPDILSNMKLEILYYDTSVVNTSKASIAALEYSLTSNHIAAFGKKIEMMIFNMMIFNCL